MSYASKYFVFEGPYKKKISEVPGWMDDNMIRSIIRDHSLLDKKKWISVASTIPLLFRRKKWPLSDIKKEQGRT